MKSNNLFLLFLLLLGGCSKKQAAFNANFEGNRDAGRIKIIPFVMVADERAAIDPKNSREQVASTVPHRLVLWITNGTPGAQILSAVLYNPKGEVAAQFSTGYVAQGENWYYSFLYSPSEETPIVGTWKWLAIVKGSPLVECKFEMLSPSKQELANLARHQAARDAAFYAFSTTWIGGRDFDRSCYFTINLRDGSTIFEVSGLSYNFDRSYISDADLLNGITYRSEAAFSFTAFRETRGNEWSTWQDVQRPTGDWDAAFKQLTAKSQKIIPNESAAQPPHDMVSAMQQGGFNLVFEIMQRDGHWEVTSNSGARWIDKRQVSDGEDRGNAPIRPAMIEKASGELASPRKNFNAEAESLTKTMPMGPTKARSDMKHTMESLNGKS